MFKKIGIVLLTCLFAAALAADLRAASAGAAELRKAYDEKVQVGGVDVRTVVTFAPPAAPAPAAPPAPRAATVPAKPGKKGRPTIALFPFTIADPEFWKYFKKGDEGVMTDKFITAMVKTRKFDVVERKKLDKILDEQKLSSSGMVDPARAVQMGRLLGADYFVFGTISIFTTKVDYKEIPYTSRFNEYLTANVVVDMRIVDTRTGRIVAAEKGDIEYLDKKIVKERRELKAPRRFLDDLQRATIEQLVLKTVDAIYPVKISASKSGVIFLNRGSGGGVRVGDLWKVYSVGEEIKDPDTGEVLGVEEIELGTIQVTESLPRFSKAVSIKGGSNFPNGALCRRAGRPAPNVPPGARGPLPNRPNW